MVAGTVADVQGLGQSDAEVGAFLGDLGIPTSAPIATWFRNSGTTQYGGHGHIVMPAVTGSAATGQAAGAAGLVASYGLERGYDLAPNEIKQLITQTAEDVVPENTLGTGTPDPAQKGWDQHFGYGRPDLGLALERIAQGRIPPQALITSPDWFEPLALERHSTVDIGGRVSARGGGVTYGVEWAPGIEPAESEFRPVAAGAGAANGRLATIDLRQVRARSTRGRAAAPANDPTAPQKGPGDTDPNEPAFTVRVRATDAAGTRGEDRKVLFAYRDATLAPGWPRALAGGGEASQRLWDVDGDNRLDVVQPESSGTLRVLRADGTQPARLPGADTPARRRARGRAGLRARRGAARAAAHARHRRRRRRPPGRDRRHRGRARLRLGAGRHARRRLPGAPEPRLLPPAGPHAREPRQARLLRGARPRGPHRRPRAGDRRDRDGPARLRVRRERRRPPRLAGEAARREPARRGDHHRARGRRHHRRRTARARHAHAGVRRRGRRARGRPRLAAAQRRHQRARQRRRRLGAHLRARRGRPRAARAGPSSPTAPSRTRCRSSARASSTPWRTSTATRSSR